MSFDSKIFTRVFTLILTLSLMALTGCSVSDDGNGNITIDGTSISFSLPSNLSVLKTDSNVTSQSVSTMAYTDSGSDYSNAVQHFHVSHPVGEALSTVDSILCFIDQLGLKSTQMWDDTKLPRVYLVGVDESKCDSSSNQPSQGASSGGSSGSANATQLTMVTVRISRDAPNSFPRGEIWFTQNNEGGSQEIRASVDVTEPKNDTTGAEGKFELNYAIVDGSGNSMGGGSLNVSGDSSNTAFTFFESFSQSGKTFSKGASVERGIDGKNLKAAVQSIAPSGFGDSSAWVVSSDSTSVKANNKNSGSSAAGSVSEVDLNGGSCLSLENFKYRIHQYGLFNEADGSEVTLNTGISCEYSDSSSQTRHCHIGHHGAWFEPESNGSEHSFSDGDTISQRAWGSNAANDGRQLTLFVAPGKLMKYTVKSYTLAEIRGIDFRYHDGSTEYIVQYFSESEVSDGVSGFTGGDDSGFYKVASMSWSSGGPPSKTDITLDASGKIAISTDEWKHFWSDALGSVNYVGGKTSVSARSEKVIRPGDSDFSGGELALKCLFRCPQASITDLSTWNSPFETDPANSGAALDYLIKESDMGFYKGTTGSNTQVALSGVSFSDQSSNVHQWGLESGALVSAADATDITNNKSGNVYAAYDGSYTYYQYRMGPNNWDKLILAKDSGNNFISFDQPMEFDYTHATANDLNGDSTYDGKKFLLRYHGDHFEGFPWDIVDRDGDGNGDMWFPQVNLKDGVQLTANSQNYRIKALSGDQTLTSQGANCSSLSLSLPSADVPSAKSGSPSNETTTKPDHGTCQWSNESESASGCN